MARGGCDEEYNYAPTEKHKPGRWGTEMDLDDDTAQKVLNESIQGGGKKMKITLVPPPVSWSDWVFCICLEFFENNDYLKENIYISEADDLLPLIKLDWQDPYPFTTKCRTIAESIDKFYEYTPIENDMDMDIMYEYRERHGIRLLFRGSRLSDFYLGCLSNVGPHLSLFSDEKQMYLSFQVDVDEFNQELLKLYKMLSSIVDVEKFNQELLKLHKK